MQSEHVGKLRGPTDKPIRIEYVAMPRSIIVGTMRQAVHKIVSGGQTGVDRAALDVALELGISIGGWVPKGRLAEDGELSVRYRDLVESDESSSELRTRLNVGSSDSTLVLTTANKSKGTELTILTAGNFSKPVCVVNVDKSDVSIREAANEIRDWLQIQKPIVLNVAGPRASTEDAHIYDLAKQVLHSALREYPTGSAESLIPDSVLNRALENLRHWDSIRWLVPFWYLSVSGASFGYMLRSDAEYVRATAAALLAVGLACLWLVYRTIRYHQLQRLSLARIYLDKNISEKALARIFLGSSDILLSMDLGVSGVTLRATTWFLFLMTAVCAVSALVLWYGDINSMMSHLEGWWAQIETPLHVPKGK